MGDIRKARDSSPLLLFSLFLTLSLPLYSLLSLSLPLLFFPLLRPLVFTSCIQLHEAVLLRLGQSLQWLPGLCSQLRTLPLSPSPRATITGATFLEIGFGCLKVDCRSSCLFQPTPAGLPPTHSTLPQSPPLPHWPCPSLTQLPVSSPPQNLLVFLHTLVSLLTPGRSSVR